MDKKIKDKPKENQLWVTHVAGNTVWYYGDKRYEAGDVPKAILLSSEGAFKAAISSTFMRKATQEEINQAKEA